MKILTIDDSNALRFMMIKILRELGYKDIDATGTAEDALILISNNKYDLILLDWNLPKMSGIDFLKIIRADPKTEKLAVVMVTTVQERSNILGAIKIGLQGYLIKPISRDLLSAKCKEIESKKTILLNE